MLAGTTSGVTTHYWSGLDLLAQSDGASTEYLAYDGLGTVRQLVDGSCNILTVCVELIPNNWTYPTQ